jgi:hypothetical protein
MKKFLVIPGISSPTHEKYVDVYALLKEEAIKRGYDFEVLYLPGQADVEGEYGFEKCAEAICKKLVSFQQNENGLRLMALSAGCPLLMSSLARLEKEGITLSVIDNIVLYGPSSYEQYWKSLTEEDGMNKIGMGTKVMKNCFREWEPIEYLLPRTKYLTKLVVGSLDNYVPLFFLDYLNNLCTQSKNQLVSFHSVDACGHNVKKTNENNWRSYIDTIFAN